MEAIERYTVHRPPFDLNGQLVARREMKLGDKTLQPGEPLPAVHGFTPRQLRVFYQFGHLDTLPREAPAAAKPAPQASQSQRARR